LPPVFSHTKNLSTTGEGKRILTPTESKATFTVLSRVFLNCNSNNDILSKAVSVTLDGKA
jgi:hypothetical protein